MPSLSKIVYLDCKKGKNAVYFVFDFSGKLWELFSQEKNVLWVMRSQNPRKNYKFVWKREIMAK